ncbi:ATP-binding protein [Thauera sp. WH-1]|uniref:ATP-binding protein n=1 Tax=Thauera sp. WH-1 TaxID=3398230 RepID=UPI0039FC13AE
MPPATLTTPPANPADGAPSLWLRLILPLVLISLLMSATGMVGYRYLSEEIRRETHRTLAVIAEQKREQIENSLRETRIDAESYFSTDSRFESLFAAWLASGREDGERLERMRSHLVEVAQRRGWGGLALLDAALQPVLHIGGADIAPHAALAADLLIRPRIELVDLHRDAAGVMQYGVLAPIGDHDAPTGVVYLSWKAEESLYPLVESWPVPTRTAETYLVRRDAEGVRFLTPLRHAQEPALALTRALDAPALPAARAVQGSLGILENGLDYRGVPVLAYAAAVAGTPWLMLAEIDEREAYSGIRSMAWATGLVMGLGLLLVYSAGYLLWRRSQQRQELVALQAQRAAEARFRVIFEQAPLGVVLLDSDSGRITEANPRFAEIVGRPVASLTGLDPARITHPEDVHAGLDELERLRDGASADYRLNKRYLRPDGSTVWASLTGAPVQVDSEQAPRHLVIVEDISERKEMEERLRQATATAEAANAAKSEFLAHMSHEIRTPMNAVLGLAQVLEREPLAPGQRDMVERIRSAGQSLLAILNDVLDLSKIEAGQLRIEPRPFELGVLLANVDSLMGQAARAKGLALHVEAARAPQEPLLGDGLRIEQVLFNLTGNAIKFTERGEVTVQVDARDTGDQGLRLRVEVRDTGIGIAPEVLGRLFAPFAQADAGIARRFGGTGLGLSICKRLVELMGGEIGVDSQPGTGSTFWFELPLQRLSADQMRSLAPRPVTRPSGPRLQGAHLLVVDDSAMNRDLVERALRLEGATATLAADGQQAVQLLKTRPQGFDAVLMDVQMPVMDGLSATRAIRAELGLHDLPVIAFTAGVRDAQQAAARAAGANDVLPKPMDLEQMAVLLTQWVRPRQATRATTAAPSARLAQAGAHAADAAGEDSDAFPLIDGIDRERAAQRLAGDRSMFLSLLQMFVEDNADAVAAARSELARGEREAAGRRLHTLASNAGFLCALDLMAAARALEEAIERGETALDAALAALEQQIGELVTASAPWR